MFRMIFFHLGARERPYRVVVICPVNALINSLHDKVKRRGLRSMKVAKGIQSEGKWHDAYKSKR